MSKFISGLKLLLITKLLISIISVGKCQCPESVSVAPCICVHMFGRTEFTCENEIGLPQLTALLRNEMCGKMIDKFELLSSDVQYLPSNLFFKVKVKEIRISYTNISHFTRAGKSAFFGQEYHLNTLQMKRCRLVDNLQWQMIGELKALTYLDLSSNDLTTIRKEWFQHPPPKLLTLLLRGNKIKSIERGALSTMHSLIQLDLSENRITTLSRDMFPLRGNLLIILSLSDNRIRSLPENIFEEMMGLRRLYLDDNRIATLPKEVWSSIWGDLEYLDLNGNPIKNGSHCDWMTDLRPPTHLYGNLDCEAHIHNVTAEAELI